MGPRESCESVGEVSFLDFRVLLVVSRKYVPRVTFLSEENHEIVFVPHLPARKVRDCRVVV